MHIIEKRLSDPKLYLNEIDRLHQQLQKNHKLFDKKQNGAQFYQISMQRKKIAKMLARSVSQQEYELTICQQNWIDIAGKSQPLLSYPITDRIVIGALYQAILPETQTTFHETLFSFIKGRSNYQATKMICEHLKNTSKNHPNGHLDLYVLKTDICDYTNSIPIGPQAPIWGLLKSLISHCDPSYDISPYLWNLLSSVIRPSYYTPDGNLVENFIGVAYGTQMTTLIANLYLSKLDHQLSLMPDLFHIRYGDDIVLMHKNPDILNSSYALLKEFIHEYHLSINPDKNQWIYLTKAGRPCSINPLFCGKHEFDYLGFNIQADGSLRIKKKYTHQFMKQVHSRIRSSAHLTKNLSLDQRASAICSAVNEAMRRESPFIVKDLHRYYSQHDDRKQLKQMDRQIALWVAQALCGVYNQSAFRIIPYKKIRSEWHLPSLCHTRNLKSAR